MSKISGQVQMASWGGAALIEDWAGPTGRNDPRKEGDGNMSWRGSKNQGWTLASTAVLALVIVSCGGDGSQDEAPSDQGGQPAGDGDSEGDGGGNTPDGEVFATITVGDDSWEFTNVACLAGTDSLDFLASTGIIGVTTDPTVVVKVLGDWDRVAGGEIRSIEIGLVVGAFTQPTVAWSSTLDVGGASVSVNGSRVSGEGAFDNLLTDGTIETIAGSFEGDCGETLEAPPLTTTTLPDFEANGSVTVDGETFVFTYEPPGRCGLDAGDGKLSAIGVLVDDPSRQVVFTYAAAESSLDGNPVLQLIIYGPDGGQLWYSAIGYGGNPVGSVGSLTVEGNTVMATGTLQRSGTDEFVSFTAEATCIQ